jgi:hypothetical protein
MNSVDADFLCLESEKCYPLKGVESLDPFDDYFVGIFGTFVVFLG